MNLFEYQIEAKGFIGKTERVYLALDMGMGKTLTALSAGADFAEKNVLVIAEKNEIVNSKNFKKEAELLGMSYLSLREDELPDGKGFVCGINPDGLAKLNAAEVNDCFDFIVMDEATMAKTTTTARFKIIRKICELAKYVVLLSGTPMMNGAAELYAPILLLGHPLAGDGSAKARTAFEGIFAGGHRRKIKNTGHWYLDYVWWAKGANHVRELRYLIQSSFFFKQKSESDIFKKKKRVLERVVMTVPWIEEYKQAWDKYLIEAKKRDVDLNNVMELQQLIENGQLYQVNSRWKARRVVEDIASGKYGDQRIIVFSMFVETDELVQRLLDQAGIKYKTFDTPNGLQDFKAGEGQVLVGRIKAHGKGGNVPEASVCLFVDMDFVPANNIQAENRIDRPEQKNDMTVVYYMTEGGDVIDAHVRAINQDKIRKINEFMRPLTEEEVAGMPAALERLFERYRRDFSTLGIMSAEQLRIITR